MLVVKDNFKAEWIKRNGTDPIPEGSIMMQKPLWQWSSEDLYIGRACYDGSCMTGKISTKHKCIFVPNGGKEHKITGPHEILVIKRDFSKVLNRSD